LNVTVNLLLELVIEVIVKAAFPLLISVNGTVAKAPICTESKLIEVGATLRLGPLPAVPIPENGTTNRGAAGSVVVKAMMPACGPLFVGENRTVTLALPPGPRVKVAGDAANIGFELVIDVIVSVPAPLLEAVIV
jgi:hypothetical protein